MKHAILVTAGHIDHGKTALIKALTGVDTDRLPEEKQRGITIDLGFAQLCTDDVCIDLVDVPGHAHYIKNMLAGASSADTALMVVAADEGVMPQTLEHLRILELLGVRRGLIALTKCDLVDTQLRMLAREDVLRAFQKSFLETAPVFAVSVRTGEGMTALNAALAEICNAVPARRSDRAFRLGIDRVFSVAGVGTVATGTVQEGCLHPGALVAGSPAGVQLRVRALQSGNVPCDVVAAGQRAAVALSGKAVLRRGDMLLSPVLAENSAVDRMDVLLTVLAESPWPVCQNMRLHLAIGTASVLCRVSLPGGKKIAPGERGFARLRLEEKVTAFYGDRFVIRFYSPLKTIGGGKVLDAHPTGRMSGETYFARLCCYETAPLKERILFETRNARYTAQQLRRLFLTYADAEWDGALQTLLAEKNLTDIGGFLMPPESVLKERERLTNALTAYHNAYPLFDGIPLAEAAKICPEQLLHAFAMQGIVSLRKTVVGMPQFCPYHTARFHQLSSLLLDFCEAAGFMPPTEKQALDYLSCEDEREARRLLFLTEQSGQLLRLDGELLLTQTRYQAVCAYVCDTIRMQGAVTLGQVRDAFSTSRKYAAAFLALLERQGITVFDGEKHLLAIPKKVGFVGESLFRGDGEGEG